jgi:glycosyltransferase involved in cell wall biosynthesis
MKIAIVSRIYSPEPSAASFMLEAIADSLVAHGDSVEVVTTKFPHEFSEIESLDYQISRSPVFRDENGYVRGYFQYLSFDIPLFFRLLFRKKTNLYFVEPPPTTGFVVRIISILKRTPYVYDAADIWSDAAMLSTSNKFVLWIVRRMELFALHGAKRIFTISEGVSQRLKELGINRPISVSGFGVDADVFCFDNSRDESRTYFVYAGTFSEPHGASIFLDAFSEFSKIYPRISIKFVGNGTEKQHLLNLAQELQLENVEVLNSVSPVELNTILNGAIASLASLKPGTGYEYAFTTKIYASLASGCPVIFAGEGPTKPFIDELSLSQKPGISLEYKHELVSSAMVELVKNSLSNAERKELSDWSRRHYSLSAVAESIVQSIHSEMSS